MNALTYRGYTGVVDYDAESGTLHGEVIDLRDGITFQSASAADIEQEFHRSVDEYLKVCQERGRTPDKPFSGKLALRLPAELHRQASVLARQMGKSLNQWIVEAITERVS